jgi:uncharacterized membrane protein YsdA (DUF1294 family)
MRTEENNENRGEQRRTEENNLVSANAVFGTTAATITMNIAHSHIEHGVHRKQIVLLCSPLFSLFSSVLIVLLIKKRKATLFRRPPKGKRNRGRIFRQPAYGRFQKMLILLKISRSTSTGEWQIETVLGFT